MLLYTRHMHVCWVFMSSSGTHAQGKWLHAFISRIITSYSYNNNVTADSIYNAVGAIPTHLLCGIHTPCSSMAEFEYKHHNITTYLHTSSSWDSVLVWLCTCMWLSYYTPDFLKWEITTSSVTVTSIRLTLTSWGWRSLHLMYSRQSNGASTWRSSSTLSITWSFFNFQSVLY